MNNREKMKGFQSGANSQRQLEGEGVVGGEVMETTRSRVEVTDRLKGKGECKDKVWHLDKADGVGVRSGG